MMMAMMMTSYNPLNSSEEDASESAHESCTKGDAGECVEGDAGEGTEGDTGESAGVIVCFLLSCFVE